VELNTGGYVAAQAGNEPPGSRPEDGAGHLTVWRRVAPAVGLFLLAPLVGEYLLGNLSIRDIVALLFLAPMYGGGALLIREVAPYRSWRTSGASTARRRTRGSSERWHSSRRACFSTCVRVGRGWLSASC
jgi:hypothetical protein